MYSNTHASRHNADAESGTTMVEAALVFPLMVFMILFSIEFGYYILARYQAMNASTSLAQFAANNSNVTRTDVENFLAALHHPGLDFDNARYCVSTTTGAGSCTSFGTFNTAPPWSAGDPRTSYNVVAAVQVPYEPLTPLGHWFGDTVSPNGGGSSAATGGVEVPLTAGQFMTNWGTKNLGQDASYRGPGNWCRYPNPVLDPTVPKQARCRCPVGYTPTMVWEFYSGEHGNQKTDLFFETAPTASVSGTGATVNLDMGNPHYYRAFWYGDPKDQIGDPIGAKVFLCVNEAVRDQMNAAGIIETRKTAPPVFWSQCTPTSTGECFR